MRAFLVACLAIVVIGAAAFYIVNATQKPTGVAYTTDGARINPKWSWRTVFRMPKPPATQTAMNVPASYEGMFEECQARDTWQWIFVDFGRPAGESSVCSASQ
jgi:hypothetical protein